MENAPAIRDLAGQCAEETARYRRREPYAERPCMELFRQALVHHDDTAWEAIYTQYHGAVRQWLGDPSDSGDEGVTAAFERFWHAIDAAKFARFGSLSAILQYLKMCANAVRIDRLRATRSSARLSSLDESVHEIADGRSAMETVDAELDARELWRVVQETLVDERERQVVYLSYTIGLTPREICARRPAEFPDVQEVYRLKRNALDRLRRAAPMRTFA